MNGSLTHLIRDGDCVVLMVPYRRNLHYTTNFPHKTKANREHRSQVTVKLGNCQFYENSRFCCLEAQENVYTMDFIYPFSGIQAFIIEVINLK
jgi:hypothetical protein